MSEGTVLFEFVQLGRQMRVAAIDESTGIEVIIIAPLNAARSDMERLALAKLRRKLATQQSAAAAPGKYA